MEIEVDYKGNIAFLKLVGELDIATVDSLVEQVLEVNKNYNKIVFDFSGVAFVDSTGVGNIIKLLQDNSDINYAITNLQDDVQEIFDILNLKEVLGVEVFIDSKQEAVEYLRDC